MLNTCAAYSAAGAVVRQRWPPRYNGPQAAEAAPTAAAEASSAAE